MRIDQAANQMFAYHQTFHPRFGWLKKGFDAATNDPGVFLADDATVRLGVGKNMVASIRFWTAAFHVLDRYSTPDNARVMFSGPTPLGRALLDENVGLDPYFEDLATLWVLHWHLVSSTTDVPVWWSTFNSFTALEFSEEQLLQFVCDEVNASNWVAPNASSIEKDVDCLLHMYAPRVARARQGIDDLLDSPFRELRLIIEAPGNVGNFRFNRGPKPGLTDEIIVYLCLDFVARNEADARTATVTHLANDPGTPGRLLKLPEEVIHAAMLSVADRFDGVSVTSPAGAPQLAIERDPKDLAALLLVSHYSKRNPEVTRSVSVAGNGARTLETQEDLRIGGRRAPKSQVEGGARRPTRKTNIVTKNAAKKSARA
jgi:hypothetical protein